MVPEGTPVDRYGKLQVSGSGLADESGNPVQLNGPSSMWLNWDDANYATNLDGLKFMRDEWGLEIFRIAMGITPEYAYLDDPEGNKAKVRTIVDNAIALGVYVIIDWHDHEAEDHQTEAQSFFTEMAQTYFDTPNVLYEIYNEPLDISWSGVLKPYHEALIGTIRAQDPDNVIILGTPKWSQDVDVAAADPVSGENLIYTLHFYACDHTGWLRDKADTALGAGIPLMVTEWGATAADGGLDGSVCEAEAQAWHDWMGQHNISWTAWKLDGCSDSSCYFVDRDVSPSGGWGDADLHGHAPFVIAKMRE
jgi:endoglucanase